MMALDGKTIIKEEITDKEVYEAAVNITANNTNKCSIRRTKVNSSSSCSSKDSNCSSNSSTNGSQLNNNNNNNSSSSNSTHSILKNCRTPPDSPPESARAVAPHSPMSPQLHHSIASGLAPPPLPARPNRNGSASPVINGATTTPPPSQAVTAAQTTTVTATQAAAAVAAAAAAHVEQARLLSKIRKFLGSLVQLAQDIHPEVSDRVRALVLSLGSGGISIDEFRLALQDVIQLPLRSYVVPLLKNHVTLLQREIATLARANNQTLLQYVTSNENAVMEFSPHGPSSEYTDIFVQLENVAAPIGNGSASSSSTSLMFKRRSSDTLLDHHNSHATGNMLTGGVSQDWTDYLTAATYPPPKRLLSHIGHGFGAAQPTLFDYSTGSIAVASAVTATVSTQNSTDSFSSLMEKNSTRRERDERERELRSNEALVVGTQRHSAGASIVCSAAPTARTSTTICATVSGERGGSGVGGATTATSGQDEEWKNIHTMLNCISAMVDKTKRAITILQQRGVTESTSTYTDLSPATLHEIRRQTEEKVAEFKRNAEDAVNQVKRQAVIEIQRAVVAAESRASEVMAQERLRMEKFFIEMSRQNPAVGGISGRSTSDRDIDNKSPTTGSAAVGQNACWNCGRKATETCSGCNLARYCGAFCQHKDWEHHHQICGTTRSTEHNASAKHAASAAAVSQLLPLTTNICGTLARSPSTPSAQQQVSNDAAATLAAQPQSSNSGGGAITGGSGTQLGVNGIGTK